MYKYDHIYQSIHNTGTALEYITNNDDDGGGNYDELYQQRTSHMVPGTKLVLGNLVSREGGTHHADTNTQGNFIKLENS